jgi:transposase-like protein
MLDKIEGGATGQPATEVPATATRRRFTAEYKLTILKEADRCSKPGEIGELLRREGLYSAALTQWRHQRDEGLLKTLQGRRRGRKARKDERDARIQDLERENRKLKKDLIQAKALIEVQKKLSEILGLGQPEQESDQS